MTVRPPAVAGLFYPADPEVLAATVDRLVDAVEVPPDEPLAPAYVVPHAAYRFSGPTAAHVYARLRRHAGDIRRIVLIGPSHRVPLVGAAVGSAARWRTPLGEVGVAAEAVAALVARGHAVVADDPHSAEHSIEVQIPFLQRVIGADFEIVPVGIGQSTVDAAAAAIAPCDVVLCSTDLSHYLTDARARKRDLRTATAIVDLAPHRIGSGDACGVFALRGLLAWAAAGGLRARPLHLATSADTGGPADRVVGYPAVALYAQ